MHWTQRCNGVCDILMKLIYFFLSLQQHLTNSTMLSFIFIMEDERFSRVGIGSSIRNLAVRVCANDVSLHMTRLLIYDWPDRVTLRYMCRAYGWSIIHDISVLFFFLLACYLSAMFFSMRMLGKNLVRPTLKKVTSNAMSTYQKCARCIASPSAFCCD